MYTVLYGLFLIPHIPLYSYIEFDNYFNSGTSVSLLLSVQFLIIADTHFRLTLHWFHINVRLKSDF